jgi:hypothetical protein
VKRQTEEDTREIRRWICLARPEEEPAKLPPYGAEGGKSLAGARRSNTSSAWLTTLSRASKRRSPQSVKLKPGETVVFAYIVYKSRAHRDRVNAKVMKDPRLTEMMEPQGAPV